MTEFSQSRCSHGRQVLSEYLLEPRYASMLSALLKQVEQPLLAVPEQLAAWPPGWRDNFRCWRRKAQLVGAHICLASCGVSAMLPAVSARLSREARC